jgi:hypothetical protein
MRDAADFCQCLIRHCGTDGLEQRSSLNGMRIPNGDEFFCFVLEVPARLLFRDFHH